MARGGYRPGAGRPKKAADKPISKALEAMADNEPVKPKSGTDQAPLDYMLAVMNDPDVDQTRRDRMAIAAAPYVHGRAEDNRVGKKELRQEAANKAAERFAVPAAPKLVVNNK